MATKTKVLVRLLYLLCSGAAQHRCCWPAPVPSAAHSVAPQPHWLYMFDITIVADDHVYPPASVRVAMRGGLRIYFTIDRLASQMPQLLYQHVKFQASTTAGSDQV